MGTYERTAIKERTVFGVTSKTGGKRVMSRYHQQGRAACRWTSQPNGGRRILVMMEGACNEPAADGLELTILTMLQVMVLIALADQTATCRWFWVVIVLLTANNSLPKHRVSLLAENKMGSGILKTDEG